MHPDTTVIFKSKHPFRTWYLEIQYPTGHKPEDLLAALKEVTWTMDCGGVRQHLLELPIEKQTIYVGAPGTGLFNSWTNQEYERHMKSCRKALKKFGFSRVPKHRCTYAELI